MASSVALAARNDPLAFGILGEIRAESQIRGHLAGAVEAIHKGGRNAALSEPQRSALEAIVLLTGRPVLFIRNDDFELPTGMWELLAPYHPGILDGREVCWPYRGLDGLWHAICRVRLRRRQKLDHDQSARAHAFRYTSFGCVGSSTQVARWLSTSSRNSLSVADKVEFPVEGVFWIDERPNVDLALLKLDVSGHPAPVPLRLQNGLGYANVGNNVYVVGYPAADPNRNDPNEMHRIFGGVYEKKRLAPGRVSSIDSKKGHLSHDCSTLGGSSGSCVVDLSTNSVVGLHFEGDYLVSNSAVLLPALASDRSFAALNWQEGKDA